MKSYKPPINPANIKGFAWLPPFSPETSTCVVAVASGEGILAVHLLDEVFAEGDQQHDAQQTAEERREEDLPEGGVEPRM